MTFVAGEPALLLSRHESSWREVVRQCGSAGLRTTRLRFVVSSWRRGGHLFDLDNLVDPVLGVVAAPPRERKSVWATVELGDPAGVEISEAPPPSPPALATTVKLSAPPQRSIRTAERLAELVEQPPLGTAE